MTTATATATRPRRALRMTAFTAPEDAEKRAAALAKAPGVDCIARAVTEAIGANA